MNKVLNINLGGYPFTIDEDAYEHLRQYLNSIHRHFKKSEGYEEITSDIEARLAELLGEHLGQRKIIGQEDVKQAISIMGTPEEFGAESDQDQESEKSSSRYQTGKRLFRYSDEKIIGGVCAGISAYFGIQDPIWVRVFFLVLALSGGVGVPLYVILWWILPDAQTAGDRLAMRGEPINASNIGRIIEEELRNFSEKVSEFGEEFQSKKKVFPRGMRQEMPLRKGFL